MKCRGENIMNNQKYKNNSSDFNFYEDRIKYILDFQDKNYCANYLDEYIYKYKKITKSANASPIAVAITAPLSIAGFSVASYTTIEPYLIGISAGLLGITISSIFYENIKLYLERKHINKCKEIINFYLPYGRQKDEGNYDEKQLTLAINSVAKNYEFRNSKKNYQKNSTNNTKEK